MKENSLIILLASEDKEWCHAVSSTLVPLGFIVHIATNGNDAIYTLGMKRYDIAFIAVNLPGKNGMQVLGVISTILEKPTVVIMCKDNTKYNLREYLMNGAYICIRKGFSVKDIQTLCNKLLEREIYKNEIWAHTICPFYRSAIITCHIHEGVKNIDDLTIVMHKCTIDNYHECYDYIEIKKQRDSFKGVNRRKSVRIDTDLLLRYQVCGESGTRHVSVRNISETALMFEAKEQVAQHSIISAGLHIPGRESPLQILGRGYRTEKINHSDSYNTVMIYQLIDKPTRKVIKSYIHNCIRKTNPRRSIIQKLKDLVR